MRPASAILIPRRFCSRTRGLAGRVVHLNRKLGGNANPRKAVYRGDMEHSFKLDLPPGYSGVSPPPGENAFAHACAIASEQGAGAFVHVRRADLVDFAVVLEPDEPLVGARRAFFACMHALAEAIAAHCPPEREVVFRWPDAIIFDAGLVGGGRLAWPQGCREDEAPEWLVFGAMLRSVDPADADTGAYPDSTSLVGSGFEPHQIDAVVESFARHLMLAFDTWGEHGFRAVGQDYLKRLPKADGQKKRIIDVNGDLVTSLAGGASQRSALAGALNEHEWYDALRHAPTLTPKWR